KIPCPSCGLTRAVLCILKIKIVGSFKYNIIAIPVILLILFLLIGYLKDFLSKNQCFFLFLSKYRKFFIFSTSILMLLSWIVNINNPLLY
ncbi:MAG: DUF2752 domain-containing protein, partial [Bacilli bacterium]